jgi:cyclohexanone monooxygenase
VEARLRQPARKQARTTKSGTIYEYANRGALDVDDAERRREYETRWAKGGANFMHSFNDLAVTRPRTTRLQSSCASGSPKSCRTLAGRRPLAARDYPIGTKRICLDTNYFETFNRPNVSLVDIRTTPIEEITPAGVRTTEREYPFDALVFATGFDAMTGALLSLDIRGRAGESLRDKWAEGPATTSA